MHNPRKLLHLAICAPLMALSCQSAPGIAPSNPSPQELAFFFDKFLPVNVASDAPDKTWIVDTILLRAEFGDGNSEWQTMSTPRLVFLEGENASLSSSTEASYVADMEVKEFNGTFLADPRIDQLGVGFQLDAMVHGHPDNLECAIDLTRVKLIEMNIQKVAAGEAFVEVQVPMVANSNSRIEFPISESGIHLYQLPVMPGTNSFELLAVRTFRVGESPPSGPVFSNRLAPPAIRATASPID